jgi:drug/metabolite transporter (DMT)-like permease
VTPPATRSAGTAAPVLALTLNAFVWGVSWWPFRQLQAAGLHPLWATAALYGLVLVVLTAWRRGVWRQLRRTPALWVLVLASGSTNAAFNWGVTVGDVVRVVLLFYLMPLWALLLARWLLGERITALGLVRMAMALAGAAVVLSPEGGGWPWPRTLAEGLGVVGGATFAFNNVWLRRQAHQPDEARATAMFLGGALVSFVAASLLTLQGLAPPPGLSPPGWLLAVPAMAIAFIGANLALQYGATRLPAGVTAVVMLTEVVFAAGSAALLGAGSAEPRLLAGGALIVGAALLSSLSRDARHG